jgi:hypothetical protein
VDGTEELLTRTKSRIIVYCIMHLVIWVFRVNPWNQFGVNVADVTKQDRVRITRNRGFGDVRTNIRDIAKALGGQPLRVRLFAPKETTAVSTTIC